MIVALAIVAAYLAGSIDFAVLVARMRGVDIRQVGSGNPGASNVLRTVGKGPAAMVLVGDTLKGVVGAAMGLIASGSADPLTHWAFAAGLAAVVGHCYPVFHRFQGGRGVATGLGVLFFTVPLVGLSVLIGWILITRITKVASIGSLASVLATIPLVILSGVTGLALFWFGLTVALVVFRHKDNIIRMIRGAEKKVTS